MCEREGELKIKLEKKSARNKKKDLEFKNYKKKKNWRGKKKLERGRNNKKEGEEE
jgi:hypothetical protein